MGLFDKLDNLQELRRLDDLKEMRSLEHLEKLDNLDKLKQLENLNQLQNLNQLDKLDGLKHLQQMPSLEPLNKLDQIPHLQSLGQLQHLDKLIHMQQLTQLQNLKLLKEVGQLEQLHHLDQLQHLQVIERLEKLEQLNRLPELRALKNLDSLVNINQLDQLDKLTQLGKLTPLKRLSAIERVWDFNYGSLLYLSSVIVPGLIFQETISIFLKERLGPRRAIVLMAIYNVLTLFICLNFVYNRLTLSLLESDPVYYYLAWFYVILLLPFLLGWLVAFLMNRSMWGISLKETLFHKPVLIEKNAWGRFLSEAESYQLVVTLRDESKIRGRFNKGMMMPGTSDPDDLYVNETSRFDPETGLWKNAEQTIGVWVKGSEIKTVEVLSQI